MKKIILFITSAYICVSFIGCTKNSSTVVNDTFNEAKAISMVIKDHTDFPLNQSDIITKELPTGGPLGSTAKVKFITKAERSSMSAYVVTLTKDWNITASGTYAQSSWKYKVTPDSITLLESNDNDTLINSMK